MKIGLRLSFEKGSLNSDYFFYIIEKYVQFEPYAFSFGSETYPWNEKKHKEILNGYIGEYHTGVYDLKGNIITFGTTGTIHPHISINIELDDTFFAPDNNEIESIISAQGFVSAYLYNQEYVFVQSEEFENNFKGQIFSEGILESIKNTPYEIGVFDTKEFDIRFNPGRAQLIGYTWLMAAYKMWFGSPFFKLVPKERILGFPDAIYVEEISSDKVYVQLFEKIEGSHSPNSMMRQWKWRKWLDFDSLENRFND